MKRSLNILIAAGGTGGHLFPAIAVLKELESIFEGKINAEFIGTANRMESEIVPNMGYTFNSVPIVGYYGLGSIKTYLLPFKILQSIYICKKIIRRFKPDLVLCTGAYISYPAGIAAAKEKIPLFLMESNINPGKAIKALSKHATKILASFENTNNYFDDIIKKKIIITGNPVRNELSQLPDKDIALKYYDFENSKKTIFVFGGSLGAKTINIAIEKMIQNKELDNFQVIWQTGKNYVINIKINDNIKVLKFIDNMSMAYAAADLVVSRSGATTIAELAITGKPSILIPLSTASNNEQMLNALEFVKIGASNLIENKNVEFELSEKFLNLISDDVALNKMSEKAKTFAKPNAAIDAVRIILESIS